jgi:hypothetical protein
MRTESTRRAPKLDRETLDHVLERLMSLTREIDNDGIDLFYVYIALGAHLHFMIDMLCESDTEYQDAVRRVSGILQNRPSD